MIEARRVFVTGGTGYIGRRLIPELHAHGCDVIALVREQSRAKLPWACTPVIGDALSGDSYQKFAEGADAFVHLVGVSHPSPAKAKQFREIDLKGGLEAIRVAHDLGIEHFVYMSVAQPAPVMQDYQAARAECEQAIARSGLAATVLRPWYVLGPGHRWPYCLLPFYKVAEWIPQTRESAFRLGLVTIRQMVQAIVHAVDQPSDGIRVLGVPEIRMFGNTATDRAKKFVKP
ncbi:MAG: NAD-dependent epimerase/dehydratase family protein [Acidobacteriaceae bacterium]|nr:NAD-dependent epimerase/dehydratase family protein [Acidobacteriaceae bacterium]MBV9295285.1 NAD-dependent epimerase/dehydratase family protein [Acidobacteriaceae bacterium]MBV9766077.1 NAD-dependent epimerase/dehydratase family protein [Acidobacteriaceae bacterium]